MSQINIMLFLNALILSLTLTTTLCESSTEEMDKDFLESIQGKPIGVGLKQLKADEIEGFPAAGEFFQNYVINQKPLIMRSAGKQSPAFHKWTDEYFLSLNIPEDEILTVEVKKKEDRSGNVLDMNLHEFLQVYNKSDIYMVQSLPDYLRQDLNFPCPLRCAGMKLIDTLMWFSSGDTKSVLHTDDVDNINCLFRGTKTLLMIDSKYREFYHLDHPERAFSSVDVDAVDYTKYPGLAKVEYYNISMLPGDCLFLPYRWAHQVRSYTSNLAVNVWWDHSVNEKIDTSMCTDNCDEIMTFDEFTFTGMDERSIADLSREDIKSSILQMFGYKAELSIDKLTETTMKTQYVTAVLTSDTEDTIVRYLHVTFGVIDANGDGAISKDELESCDDECWSTVMEYIKHLAGMGLDEDVDIKDEL